MKKILIAVAVLFFLGQASYMAFNALLLRPDKTFVVRFKEVPPVIKFAGDVAVYYRGYKVGKASCKKLSSDQQYILFCIQITYKDLILPRNTEIILKTQDVFGDRYFELIYPENPSSEMLVNGDIIDGTAVYERLDKYLVEQMENGELGELISNLNWLTGGARGALGGGDAKLGKLSAQAEQSMNDLSDITGELKAILADPKVQKDIKTAIHYAPESLRGLNAILGEKELQKTIKTAPYLLNRTVTGLETVSVGLPEVNRSITQVNTNLRATNTHLPQVNSTLYTTNSLLGGTNCLLGNTNGQLGELNPKIPVIPPIPSDLFIQADNTLKRVDCMGEALSDTMSKRALFLQFMFAKPGKSFENCAYPPCQCPPYTTCPDYYYYNY